MGERQGSLRKNGKEHFTSVQKEIVEIYSIHNEK